MFPSVDYGKRLMEETKERLLADIRGYYAYALMRVSFGDAAC